MQADRKMMKTGRILVVDDEARMRRILEIMLRKVGHEVLSAGNGVEALTLFKRETTDLVITDLRMPEMDGLELLRRIRELDPDLPVIVITAHGTIDTAVTAMKNGASDYIQRPFDIDVLELAVARALNAKDISRQNAFLRDEIDRGWAAFVGVSPSMKLVYDLIQRAGPSKAAVLITGETGTGKELAARAIHHASARKDKLFVPINCAAIPAEILESELFGHEKGAFTGAIKERIGKFELASGGTVFLDELTEMPIALQAKLLRVLQENALERLGGNRTIDLDIRVIAATNRDPLRAIHEGKLREDLYYRVNVVSIKLPSLRERREDIPLLAAHFVVKHGGAQGRLDTGFLDSLRDYHWPGNVRELENMIERALILGSVNALDEARRMAPASGQPGGGDQHPLPKDDLPRPLNKAVEALEIELIQTALARADGNKARAAALLDISERTLWYKLKKYFPDR
jgi:two-component system response regulator AtoC